MSLKSVDYSVSYKKCESECELKQCESYKKCELKCKLKTVWATV